MRGVLSWSAALAIGFGGAWVVASIAFTVLDGLGLDKTNRDCHEILCDVNWLPVALLGATSQALGAWLTGKARGCIASRLRPPPS